MIFGGKSESSVETKEFLWVLPQRGFKHLSGVNLMTFRSDGFQDIALLGVLPLLFFYLISQTDTKDTVTDMFYFRFNTKIYQYS